MDAYDVNMTSLGLVTNLTSDLSSLLNLTDFMSLQQPFDVPHIRWIYICLFTIVFLGCVIGNAVVIYVILRHRKMRNVTNFFLANLALSDLCVGLFCVLPNLTTFLSPYWLLGKALCKLYYFIQCTSYTASILILTVISLERYFAIIHPMLNKRITRMCLLRVVVVIIWLCAALYGMPNLIAYDIYRVRGDNVTLEFCVITGHWTIDMEIYSIINFVVLYVLPLLLISAMYIRISRVLWKSGRNMGVTSNAHFTSKTSGRTAASKSQCPRCMHDGDVKTSTVMSARLTSRLRGVSPNSQQRALKRECDMNEKPAPKRTGWFVRHVISHSQWARSVDEQERIVVDRRGCPPTGRRPQCVKQILEDANRRDNGARKVANPLTRRRKVIRLLICIIVSFAICVLPHHIRLLWQNWFATGMSLSFDHLLIPPTTFFFFYANSALNPFLYALLSDHFRRAFFDLAPSWCRRHRRRKDNACNGMMARDSRTTNPRTSTMDSPMRLSLQSTMNTTVV